MSKSNCLNLLVYLSGLLSIPLPNESKCKHFPISVRRWGCTVRAKLCTAQPRGVRECVLHLCIPLMCTGKWGRTGMLHRRLTCGPSHPQIKCDDASFLRFCLGQSFCFLVYRVLVDVHKFQSRCNILACTIFHYPARANLYTCTPMGCAVHAKLCTKQLQRCTQTGISFVYAPLCVLENRGVSECYTGVGPSTISLYEDVRSITNKGSSTPNISINTASTLS